MATIQFKKGDEYLAKLSKLDVAAREEVIGSAIYAAADLMTDEIRKELNAVPTDEGFGTAGKPVKGPKAKQKTALLNSLGITSMRDDGTGYYNVKIGFDGYNEIKTKRWPNGQPNQMVARSIQKGTTWMEKHEFIKRACAKTRKKALESMKKAVDDGIQKITN